MKYALKRELNITATQRSKIPITAFATVEEAENYLDKNYNIFDYFSMLRYLL